MHGWIRCRVDLVPGGFDAGWIRCLGGFHARVDSMPGGFDARVDSMLGGFDAWVDLMPGGFDARWIRCPSRDLRERSLNLN